MNPEFKEIVHVSYPDGYSPFDLSSTATNAAFQRFRPSFTIPVGRRKGESTIQANAVLCEGAGIRFFYNNTGTAGNLLPTNIPKGWLQLCSFRIPKISEFEKLRSDAQKLKNEGKEKQSQDKMTQAKQIIDPCVEIMPAGWCNKGDTEVLSAPGEEPVIRGPNPLRAAVAEAIEEYLDVILTSAHGNPFDRMFPLIGFQPFKTTSIAGFGIIIHDDELARAMNAAERLATLDKTKMYYISLSGRPLYDETVKTELDETGGLSVKIEKDVGTRVSCETLGLIPLQELDRVVFELESRIPKDRDAFIQKQRAIMFDYLKQATAETINAASLLMSQAQSQADAELGSPEKEKPVFKKTKEEFEMVLKSIPSNVGVDLTPAINAFGMLQRGFNTLDSAKNLVTRPEGMVDVYPLADSDGWVNGGTEQEPIPKRAKLYNKMQCTKVGVRSFNLLGHQSSAEKVKKHLQNL